MTKKDAKRIVKELECMEGQIPYDGDYSNSDHEFRWYKVNNETEMAALLTVYDVDRIYEEDICTNYPDWVCVEDEDSYIDFDNFKTENSARFTSLTKCKEAFNQLLFSLNEKEIIFTP